MEHCNDKSKAVNANEKNARNTRNRIIYNTEELKSILANIMMFTS